MFFAEPPVYNPRLPGMRADPYPHRDDVTRSVASPAPARALKWGKKDE